MRLPSKKVLLIVGAIVAIPVIAFAWWLVSPLFLSKTVVEEFPMSATAQIPDTMTQDEAEKAMEVIAKIDMPAMEEMPEMPPEMNEPVAVASGQFRDGDSFHKGSGAVTLYRLPTGEGLVRFEGLSVTNGPDLRRPRNSTPRPHDPRRRPRLRLHRDRKAQGQQRRPELRRPRRPRPLLHPLHSHLLRPVPGSLQRRPPPTPRRLTPTRNAAE